MDKQREYDGKIYIRRNAKWVDDHNMVVPTALQNILNNLEAKEICLEEMSYEDAKREGDKFKQSESYSLALKYYEAALAIADTRSRVSVLLPRITSCYRKIHRPEKVISLLSEMKIQYGEGIINEALLTSAAAAYCDMDKPEEALRCCKWAYKVLKNQQVNFSGELSLVFERVKKMLDLTDDPFN